MRTKVINIEEKVCRQEQKQYTQEPIVCFILKTKAPHIVIKKLYKKRNSNAVYNFIQPACGYIRQCFYEIVGFRPPITPPIKSFSNNNRNKQSTKYNYKSQCVNDVAQNQYSFAINVELSIVITK